MPIGEIVEKALVGLPVYDHEGLTQVVAVKNNGHPAFDVGGRDLLKLRRARRIKAQSDLKTALLATRRACKNHA
jgi:hypothetical protein